jgi:F0F1-type ATP synthase delta subunit
MAPETQQFVLPLSLVTVVDLSRLRRELKVVDEFMLQADIRQAGQQLTIPRTSHNLEQIANQNRLNLLRENDRKLLSQHLDRLKTQAPTIHMSLAADPSPIFLTRLITWLRHEIHPDLLLQIGLQPSLAAGCIVRTANKYYDFSLRQHFKQHRQFLIDQLNQAAPKAHGS